ncbi:hypothetical protein AZE42_09667 [Rhizopogon vesiculosus]|uniref:Uncharacterized protein n=1 Tax=Rhizopogon vesiculosus TaxID=180088 RepID=A0A1J8PZM5_9AGAM|nr:hypothetical protein AZE42_09667 [Rhizopogon vesiculosus]
MMENPSNSGQRQRWSLMSSLYISVRPSHGCCNHCADFRNILGALHRNGIYCVCFSWLEGERVLIKHLSRSA